jgi:hypothetical protein
MKRWLLFLTVLFLQSCIFGPPAYFAKGIHAQVVDKKTRQPLEKVIVVAQWKVIREGGFRVGNRSRLHIAETITDQEGFFTIPSPKVMIRPSFNRLTANSPILSLFKKGFEPTMFVNQHDSGSAISVSNWHGKQLELPRFEEDKFSLGEEVQIFSWFFRAMYDGRVPKDWKNYPRMALLMYFEKQRLMKKGADSVMFIGVPDINDLSYEDKKFLEEFEYDF